MRRPRSSGDTVLLAAERSSGPGCVPVAVVGITGILGFWGAIGGPFGCPLILRRRSSMRLRRPT